MIAHCFELCSQLMEAVELLRPAFLTLEEVKDFLFTTLPLEASTKGRSRQIKEVSTT